MTANKLIEKLNKVEKIASASKFKRMLMSPFKYFHAILFRELMYKRKKIEKEIITTTFFDTKMHLLLPSGTDIYLTGGKSHDSEIRLAKFLINYLQPGDTFVDVGAHYGYFSLLASTLVHNNGRVYSFEASPTTYKILNKNTKNIINVAHFNFAVSDENAALKFYEFPNLYSEYNTIDITQFQQEDWFSSYKPQEINIKSIVLDDFLLSRSINPKIIKIDVEGAELKVINGLGKYLSESSPMIAMEYLSQERGNKEHQQAAAKLHALGYLSFVIDSNGHLKQIEKISAYLKEMTLESDNIVFVKAENAI